MSDRESKAARKHLGRPRKSPRETEDKIFMMLGDGLHQTEGVRRLNIARQAIYRALKAREVA